MKQAWYGPLVELGDMADNKGGHVQLLVFVLHSNPPQKVRTSKGNEALRCILYVGDSSCSNIKVLLWNNTALGHDVSAGEIVFMQNMKIIEFRGQLELTSVQVSTIVPVLSRQAILSYQGTEKLWQHGPLVEEKAKDVVAWARKTQWNLIFFLNHVSKIIKSLPSNTGLDVKADSSKYEEKVRKCSCILDISSFQEDCIVEFDAIIREIFLPYDVKGSNNNGFSTHCEYLLFSSHLDGKHAQELLKELVSYECEEGNDNNECMYAGSSHCGAKQSFRGSDVVNKTMKSRASGIFKPFYLYVGDSSGQTTLLVRHKAALQLFGDISPDDVLECLQENLCEKNEIVARSNKDTTHKTRHDLILLILIRSLLSQKNSPFRIRAEFRHSLTGSIEQLNVLSLGLPICPHL